MQESWEYYMVFRGQKRLWIEGEIVELNGGEVVEVPPGVCHGLRRKEGTL